jgi:hypothetical protein
VRRDYLDRRNDSMQRLLSLSVIVATGILTTVGVAQAGTPPVPVPEPSSTALLGVGAAAVAWWHRGRKR